MDRVAADALRKAETFELLSINPRRQTGEFHGHGILGRAMITDAAEQKRLFNALQSGARWNFSLPALCFDPRHAIRVTTGGIVTELLICFECNQVEVWQQGRHVTTFLVSGSPQSTFDGALRRAALPLSPD